MQKTVNRNTFPTKTQKKTLWSLWETLFKFLNQFKIIGIEKANLIGFSM